MIATAMYGGIMINTNNILIVAAHLDDFEFGMGGTVSKLCRSGHDVKLVVLCKGDRPGNEHVAQSRSDTCKLNCVEIGIRHSELHDYSDTYLDRVSQTELCNIVYNSVNEWKPSIVYTHNSDDIHMDHRIVSNITRVACRMRDSNPVRALYEYTIPGSTEWSQVPQSFNVYQDITDTASDKMEMLCRYTTECKTPPDPCSLKMIETRDQYHGSLCGCSRAEIFKLVYSR
jgi:LmbE family N-acetylglucosaminyl deacetylase